MACCSLSRFAAAARVAASALLLALAIAADALPAYAARGDEQQLVYYYTAWEVYWGDEPGPDARWEPLNEASVRRLPDYRGTVWLKRTLPTIFGRDPYLFLRSMKQVEVYVDGERIYETDRSLDWKYTYTSQFFQQIPLERSDSGKTIAIRADWDNGHLMYEWNVVGDRHVLVSKFIDNDWKLLVAAVVFMVAGTISLGMYARRTQEPIYAWFTLLAYSSGVGIALIMSSLQLFASFRHLYYWRDSMLPLGITAFIGFYGAALGGAYRRPHRFALAVMLACTVATVAAGFVGETPYRRMLLEVLPVCFAVSLACVTYMLIRGARAGRTREMAWLVRGYVILLLSGLIHVANNIPAVSAWTVSHIPQNDFFSLRHVLPVGLLLFMLCLAMVLFHRFAEVHRQLQRYANELAAANDEMVKFDRLKDDFLRNTSHELRTPLHGIAGLTESLLGGAAGPVEEPMRGNLRLVQHSANRLLHLVNDILDLYRLKHRDIKLQPEPVDARAIAEAVVAALAPLAQRKGLRLAARIEGPEPVYVSADANRLEQILYNLIGNAIRYTTAGEVVVSAECAAAKVIFRVEDTGPGIPPERMETLFEPFASAESAAGGGTGLGLSITKRLVQLHGGTIAVHSALGEGTCVTFTLAAPADRPAGEAELGTSVSARYSEESPAYEPVLPLAPGLAAAAEAGTVNDLADAHIRVDAAGERATEETGAQLAEEGDGSFRAQEAPLLLIVDDEAINVQVLVHYLRAEPYRLLRARDGFEALAMLETGEKPDLVLLDVMMPGMTGYDVCRRVRERWGPGDMPVILLSARNRVADLTQGFDAGANDYLSKPFSQGELLARVRIQLKLAEFHQSLEQLVAKRTAELAERTYELEQLAEELVGRTHELEERTYELEETNAVLTGSVRETAEALTEISVWEERNRIAHEIHDVVGHTLTAAIVQLEAARKLADRDFAQSVQKLDAARESVRRGLDEIRRAVRMLKDEGGEFDLAASLRELVADTVEQTGVAIDCRLEPLPPMSDLMGRVVYHSLMEGLTNGIRHGRCRRFDFKLFAHDGMLQFRLANDGEAFGAAKPGFGLTALMERVHLLGGTVDIGPAAEPQSGANAGAGFLMAIDLPLRRE